MISVITAKRFGMPRTVDNACTYAVFHFNFFVFASLNTTFPCFFMIRYWLARSSDFVKRVKNFHSLVVT